MKIKMLTDLPVELLVHLACFLSGKQAHRLRRVCRLWYEVIDESVYRTIFRTRYSEHISPKQFPTVCTGTTTYRERLFEVEKSMSHYCDNDTLLSFDTQSGTVGSSNFINALTNSLEVAAKRILIQEPKISLGRSQMTYVVDILGQWHCDAFMREKIVNMFANCDYSDISPQQMFADAFQLLCYPFTKEQKFAIMRRIQPADSMCSFICMLVTILTCEPITAFLSGYTITSLSLREWATLCLKHEWWSQLQAIVEHDSSWITDEFIIIAAHCGLAGLKIVLPHLKPSSMTLCTDGYEAGVAEYLKEQGVTVQFDSKLLGANIHHRKRVYQTSTKPVATRGPIDWNEYDSTLRMITCKYPRL